MKASTNAEIGAMIRAMREHRGLTQIELADRVGISNGYLSYLESGRRQVYVKHLVAVATALDCTVRVHLDPK